MARKEEKMRVIKLPDRSPRGDGTKSAGEGRIHGAVRRVTATSRFGRALQGADTPRDFRSLQMQRAPCQFSIAQKAGPPAYDSGLWWRENKDSIEERPCIILWREAGSQTRLSLHVAPERGLRCGRSAI